MVKVEYTGTLDDGSVFDSSVGREPLEFQAGAGQMIPGFDRAVIGMSKGQTKKVTLEPKDAYGLSDLSLTKRFPLTSVPKGMKLEIGEMLTMTLPNGRPMRARIAEVTKKEVVLDTNHPLAGKRLTFEIKIV